MRNASVIAASLVLPLGIQAQVKVLPVLNQPQPDLVDPASRAPRSIALSSRFGTEQVDEQVVRFTSHFTSAGSPVVMDFAMFTNRTPATRANLISYVNSGAYTNMFMHRSVENFVIQGGGYRHGVGGTESIPQNAPVVNEFGVSNTAWTVAMAKLDGNPNSATNQFFVNLGDNGPNLDNQNGGFTVFARVTKDTIPSVGVFANPIDFPTWIFPGISDDFPLFNTYGGFPGQDWRLFSIYFTSAQLVAMPAGQAGTNPTLTYSVLSNSNPTLVNASIASGNLSLTYTPATLGNANIVIRATDSVGNTVDDAFSIQVKNSYTTWQSLNFNSAELANPAISGPLADPENDGLTNLELFVHSLGRGATHAPATKFLGFSSDSLKKPSFRMPFRNDIAGVTLKVETSADMTTNSWIVVPHQVVTATTVGNIDTLTIEATPPAGLSSKRFYRVGYTHEP